MLNKLTLFGGADILPNHTHQISRCIATNVIQLHIKIITAALKISAVNTSFYSSH